VAVIIGLRNTGATRRAPGAKGPSDKEIVVAHSAPREVLGCPASQHSQRYAVPYTSRWLDCGCTCVTEENR